MARQIHRSAYWLGHKPSCRYQSFRSVSFPAVRRRRHGLWGRTETVFNWRRRRL